MPANRPNCWPRPRILVLIFRFLDFPTTFGHIQPNQSRAPEAFRRFSMAKGNVIKIKLQSTADTGYFYVTKELAHQDRQVHLQEV